MTEELDGQVSMFAAVTESGKTSPEPCPQTKERISKPSSRSSQGSASRTLPLCLCLTAVSGPSQESSTTAWVDSALPIASMTLSTGEFRSDADGLLWSQTLTDSLPQRFCLTLNCGEKPRTPNPTKLSQILERNPDPKYNLSAKACQGILNRAKRRGKELPPQLKAALEAQASAFRNEQESPEEEKES